MRRTPIAAALGLALLLTGCASPAPAPTTPPDDEVESPTSSHTPAFDIPCDEVLPLDDVRALFDDTIAPTPYAAGAKGSWEMQGTALLQDGALACAWTREGKDAAAVVILALDGGADGYDRSEPAFADPGSGYTPVDIADGGYVHCEQGEQVLCHWNVIAGDVWLSFKFGVLDAGELEGLVPRADGAISAAIVRAVDAITSAPRNEVERVEATLPACNESLGPQNVADALGVAPETLSASPARPVETAFGSSNPDYGQVLWAYSYERLGWFECTVQGESITFTSIVARGAAWILDEPGAVQPALVEVADLGPGISECTTEGSFTSCTVAVAVGQDLALVQLVPDDPAHGLDEALAIVRLLLG